MPGREPKSRSPRREFSRNAVVIALCIGSLASACGGGTPAKEASPVEWGYEGADAPENWGALSEEFAACADGMEQSPIDITGYQNREAAAIEFSYRDDASEIERHDKFLYVRFPPGSAMTIGERRFELMQAHAHAPSEHAVGGQGFASEMHLVHQSASGELAVVALLYRLGTPDPVIEEMLRSERGEDGATRRYVNINAADFVPRELGYFTYDGSLTTPPCSEGVSWFVMQSAVTISQDQVDQLQTISGGPSNRRLQPIGTRSIVAVS